jgi:uncharacterized membrane protein HdeD (DUF308 family)
MDVPDWSRTGGFVVFNRQETLEEKKMTLVELIKEDAKTARWVGIFMLIAGFLAMVAPFAAGLSVAVVVGVLLLVTGVTQVLLVFRAGSFGEGLMLVLLGVLSVVAGGFMVAQPVAALATLTLFLAGYFIACGILEVIAAFGARPQSGWGLLLFGGIVSVLLGVMIWQQFPLSGVWAVGVLVGVKLIIAGWALIAIGGAAKAAVAE